MAIFVARGEHPEPNIFHKAPQDFPRLVIVIIHNVTFR